MDPAQARRIVDNRPWHHAFEVAPGVRTRGDYDPETLWKTLNLPDDMSGVSLADIGASNGYFSFEARKRNARVVAFDHRHKDNSGFGLLQFINGLHDIEHHHVNVLEIRREDFGSFDIVLALGLIYHTSDPYRALASCAEVCRGRLMIESYCIDPQLPGELRGQPLMKFMSDPRRFPADRSLHGEPSNFWGFSSVCLQRMVEDLGFAARRIVANRDRVFLECERMVFDDTDTRLDLAYGVMPRTPVRGDRGDPDSWLVF